MTADLHIAGDGPHADVARVLAEELGITARVHWLGRLTGPARFDLLATARLVCVPSRYETFGMVAAEALATGTPVLAFDIPCLRSFVTGHVGVRVPPEDIDAYAAALTALVTDPARCAALGAADPDTCATWTGTASPRPNWPCTRGCPVTGSRGRLLSWGTRSGAEVYGLMSASSGVAGVRARQGRWHSAGRGCGERVRSRRVP
ncbi:glycosyltransferase [Streptomyces netropsis]